MYYHYSLQLQWIWNTLCVHSCVDLKGMCMKCAIFYANCTKFGQKAYLTPAWTPSGQYNHLWEPLIFLIVLVEFFTMSSSRRNKLLTGHQTAACPAEQRLRWRGRGGTAGWWLTSWNSAGTPPDSSKSSSTYTYRHSNIDEKSLVLRHDQSSRHKDKYSWGLTWWLWRSWAVSEPAGHWSQMRPQVWWQPRSLQKYCQ